MQLENKPYTFDRVVRILITLIIIAVLIWLFNLLKPVLIPFAIALLLAYLINPLVDFFQNKVRLKNRILAISTSFLVIIGVIVAFWIIMIPVIGDEVNQMQSLLEKYNQDAKIQERLSELLPPNLADFFHQITSFNELQSLFQNTDITYILKNLSSGVFNVFSSSLNLLAGIFTIFVVILYLIFILSDYNKFTQDWDDWLPAKFRDLIVGIVEDLEEGMNSYFRAQALIALIVGILFAIGFGIIGLPLGILLGLFVGALNLIPYLQTIGFIPATFIAVLHALETGQSFWIIMLWILIVFIIVQTIQEAVLVPRIMGNVTGLHPAIILLSLSIWGQLMGLLGLIIALPVTTIILSYYKRYFKLGDDKT